LDYSPGLEPAWAADGVDGYLDVVLDEYIIGDYDEAASGLLVYGDLSDAVGYIAILSMEGFADDFDDADDIEVLGDTLPQILSRFADKDVLVIDVRFNDGGEDANALYIAGHFADEPTLAFTKDVQGNTFVEPLELHIEPQTTQPFAGDVVVMTSGYTFSAAEVFTGAMIALPNVTTIGEATGGGFSDTLIALLPNGWHFTLSNEVYTLHDGRVYEGQGLPPDVKAPMRSTPTDRDVDPVLNHVLR
ncbi:MAG: S41 family peptidase, partial [Chloroflexota bacterium]